MVYSKQPEGGGPDDLNSHRKAILDRISGSVLEIGCGTGRMMELMKPRARSVHGIDIERRCLAICKRKGLDARYGSISKIPFPDKRFDSVVCWNLLERPKRGDIPVAAREIMRVLKPGGKLILHSSAFSAIFWDTPSHTGPESEKRIRELFKDARKVEFLHCTMPGARSFLLKLMPFRGRSATAVVVTK
jgi:ubiquinone/menaquinone biosynthesis C-methylase UbiE